MSNQNNDELYRKLYNDHPEYIEFRKQEGKLYQKYLNDVKYWKLKYIEKLIRDPEHQKSIKNVVEVGCAIGVLLENFMRDFNLNKVGIDISDKNIDAAKDLFPEISFYKGTLQDYILANKESNVKTDLVIMSDLLEHVENDVDLLNQAGQISKYVIINLPIEKVPEYKDRVYGVNDVEGHLRAYSVKDALDLCDQAGMEVVKFYSEQYVQQPVFQKYLLAKLLEKHDDKAEALLKFQEEVIQIKLDSDYYKTNFFALLKLKTKN